jgi:hypothetical protein
MGSATRRLRIAWQLIVLSLVLEAPSLHAQASPDSTVSDSSGLASVSIERVGRVTFRVVPDTVTVGQPFEVLLRAIPPRGRMAIHPPVPDTGGIVEPLDPARVTRLNDTLLVRYRLIAWQPGVLTIPFAPVQMRQDSSEIAVPLDVRVVVASVLPADTALRLPKDSRELFPLADRWWESWWQWVLGVLLALAAIFLFEKWRRRDRTPAVHTDTPLERAEAAFARLDARRLPSAGEGGRQVALAAEILRQYLADIDSGLALALTNAELLRAVAPIEGIPDRQLAQLLDAVDEVRFGGGAASPDTVQRVSGMARELVRDIDRVRSAMLVQAA